jgi:hypothetical protein
VAGATSPTSRSASSSSSSSAAATPSAAAATTTKAFVFKGRGLLVFLLLVFLLLAPTPGPGPGLGALCSAEPGSLFGAAGDGDDDDDDDNDDGDAGDAAPLLLLGGVLFVLLWRLLWFASALGDRLALVCSSVDRRARFALACMRSDVRGVGRLVG